MREDDGTMGRVDAAMDAEVRAEQQAYEAMTLAAEWRARTLTDVAGELVVRGDVVELALPGLQLTAGGSTVPASGFLGRGRLTGQGAHALRVWPAHCSPGDIVCGQKIGCGLVGLDMPHGGHTPNMRTDARTGERTVSAWAAHGIVVGHVVIEPGREQCRLLAPDTFHKARHRSPRRDSVAQTVA